MRRPSRTHYGLAAASMIGALLVTQFIGIPFAFLFGLFARRIGAKRAVFAGLGVYVGVGVRGCSRRYAWGSDAPAVHL